MQVGNGDKFEESVEELPPEQVQSNSFINVRVQCNGFFGVVANIVCGSVSKELLYMVRYDDGDVQHFTSQELEELILPHLIIQISAELGWKDAIKVTCTSMAGSEVALLNMMLTDTLGSLHSTIAAELRVDERQLRLVHLNHHCALSSNMQSCLVGALGLQEQFTAARADGPVAEEDCPSDSKFVDVDGLVSDG